MIYRVRAEQGLLVLNFDAEGYYAVDDHMNALDAYGEKDKLYVKVDSPTKYVYKKWGLRGRKASPFRAGMDSPLIFKYLFAKNFLNG